MQLLLREYRVPVVLHADDGPLFLHGHVQCLVERTDTRIAIVSPFARRVGVVHQQSQARPLAGGGPLEHLLVSVGIAKGRDGPTPDELLDSDYLAILVIDEVDRRQLEQLGNVTSHLVFQTTGASHDLVGRYAVRFLGEGTNERDTATRNDEG